MFPSRAGRVAALCVSLALGLGAASSSAGPPTPRAYLDRALALISANAVVTPSQGWPAVFRRARAMSAHAKKPADTYGAIIYALDQLYRSGDAHAGRNSFANPLQAKLQAQAEKLVGTTPTPPPTVLLLEGRVGVISVPSIGSLPDAPNSRRYVTRALTAISSLEASAAPCGWIVDLREDTGGDMYPMLMSLGPLLGDGTLMGFADRHGSRRYVSSTGGVLSGAGYTGRPPLSVAPFSPAPPVAVLTGPFTLSSGEAVTVAFRDRPDARSFGASTGGAPNAPRRYRLADGATISFSIVNDIDRNGTIYTGPIPPDAPTGLGLPDSATDQAAEQWLLDSPECARSG